MRLSRVLSSVVLSSFILSACTQAPAQVQVRGDQSYNRANGAYHTNGGYYNGSSETTQDAYVPPVSVSNNAGVSSGGIQVNDLSSPAPQAQAIQSQPLQSQAVQSSQSPFQTQAQSDAKAGVNAWTGKPRGDEPQAASGAAAPAPAGGHYIWPVSSKKVVSNFGSKGDGKANDGIDIAADQGEPVWAVADGEVVYADNSLKGYGNMVLVKHKGGTTSTYAHLSRKAVEKYDRVKQGDILGYVGTTGNVKSPQLYFAVREGTTAVDPQKYIGK